MNFGQQVFVTQLAESAACKAKSAHDRDVCKVVYVMDQLRWQVKKRKHVGGKVKVEDDTYQTGTH